MLLNKKTDKSLTKKVKKMININSNKGTNYIETVAEGFEACNF